MPTARSAKEAHLYIDLHPCSCGETSFQPRHSLMQRDDQLVAVYEGVCPTCGTERRFAFELAEELAPSDQYGGDSPSTIIDAGEFLFVSDRYFDLASARAREQTLSAHATVVPLLRDSIAALEEVLKFIPEGADEVPEAAITAEAGRALYAGNPYRFHRVNLEVGLEIARRLLTSQQSRQSG